METKTKSKKADSKKNSGTIKNGNKLSNIYGCLKGKISYDENAFNLG